MKRLFSHAIILVTAFFQFLLAFCAVGFASNGMPNDEEIGVMICLVFLAGLTLFDAWYRMYLEEKKYWLVVAFIVSPARIFCELVTCVRMIIKMFKKEDPDFAKRGRFNSRYPVSILVYILLGIDYLTAKDASNERARQRAYEERRRREQQEAQARREAEARRQAALAAEQARLNSRPNDVNNTAFLRSCFVSGRIPAQAEVNIKSCKHSVVGGKGVIDIYYTLKSSYAQYQASKFSTVDAFKDHLMKNANANIKAVLQKNFDAYCARYNRCIRELDITYHTEFIV